MQLLCPSCQTPNRVPEERLGENPLCGRCGHALLDTAPRELDDAGFGKLIARHELPVVVDFWAPWCGPCRVMAPQFEAAARALAGRISFAKVNTDQATDTASRLAIRSIPTLAVFAQGRERDRRSGTMSAADLQRWLQPFIRT